MESNDIVTILVEGSGGSNVYQYEDAPLSNKPLNSDNFFDLSTGIIVINQGDLSNPQKTLDLVYSNQKDGMGFITLPRRDALMLVENLDEGGANFYYASNNQELLDSLKTALGESTKEDPGMYLLENTEALEEAVSGEASSVKEKELLPEETVETGTSTEAASQPATYKDNSSTSTTDIVFGLISGIVIAWAIWKILSISTSIVLRSSETFKVRDKESKSKEERSKKPRKKKRRESRLKALIEYSSILDQMQLLAKNIQLHTELRMNRKDNLYKELDQIQQNFMRLWDFIESGDLSEDTAQRLTVEYDSIFTRFNRLVGEEYWVEIVNNPQDYRAPRDADARLSEVREVSLEVEERLLDNIQQLKESQVLNFDVDLTLLRGVEQQRERDLLGE